MQAYIDPKQVAIVEIVNHRETNKNYIDALADSMREVGFSAEYPVDVFKSENIPNHDLDPAVTPYVVACGVHRTFAAQKAELDKIFANIHDGGEEAWVEMMHSDNFQFDPATNRDIGQPFTPKERRAACTQLLLLPKYMEQTNTALAELWKTSESNIRRWKQEVDNLVNLNTNAAQLRVWGISDGRIERLRTVLASSKRTNSKGETIEVRKPRADASDDEKEAFFEKIRQDLYEIRDSDRGIGIDFDWEAVKRYAGEKWKIETGWRMYEDMHIDQLRKLHQRVLELDADLLERCAAIHAAVNAAIKLKEGMEKAVEKTVRMFCKLVGADNKWSETFKSKWKTFEEMVKSQFELETFGNARWDYDDLETTDDYQAIIDQHKTVQEAIKEEADWIAAYMKKEAANAAKRRKKVSENWTAKRQAAIDAINAYPRDVSFDRIVSEAEGELYKSKGYFNKIFDAESVSSKKNIGTLEDEVKSLGRLIVAIKTDVNWVKSIPAAKKLHEVIVEANEPTEPELTITADDLHGISLEDIFQHVADRVICLDGLFDENEVMMELAQILGKASRGQVGTQLYLLMKQALFLMPKSDIEGAVIEKEMEDAEQFHAEQVNKWKAEKESPNGEREAAD